MEHFVRMLAAPLIREITTFYARVEAYSQGKLQGQPLPPGLSARNMGKNDIWIAATALYLDLELHTTDNDFNHRPALGCSWLKIGRSFYLAAPNRNRRIPRYGKQLSQIRHKVVVSSTMTSILSLIMLRPVLIFINEMTLFRLSWAGFYCNRSTHE
jgi:hypothetical protein